MPAPADEVRFAADLYQGSAAYYDRYRLPYPETMTEDLARRAGVSGRGRLLDLACGTGQLAFALRRWFREVWAVDSEPDMAELVRAKAAAAGDAGIRPVVSRAETLRAGPGDWQRALAALLDRWRTALGAEGRVPAGWDLARQRRPDPQVLSGAGFEPAGRREFAVGHRWSLPELAGHIRSTSFLPAAVLGGQSAAFDTGLAAALAPLGDRGTFTETVSFAYELARKRHPLPMADGGFAGGAILAQCHRRSEKSEAPSMYEMEGAPPPAGAGYPREVPVSRYLPRSGIAPGRFPFPTVKVFLLLSPRMRKSLRQFILDFSPPP